MPPPSTFSCPKKICKLLQPPGRKNGIFQDLIKDLNDRQLPQPQALLAPLLKISYLNSIYAFRHFLSP